MSNRLSGVSSLAYQGTNATMPPNMFFHDRAPGVNDYQNVSVGDFWIYRVNRTTNNNLLYVLMGVAGNIADWVILTGGTGNLTDLTGNTGGVIAPDGSGNINVLGDTTTINIVGNPVTHTLTASAVGTGLVQSLTGNSGGAVFPTAGNTNIVGDGVTVNVVGNPGTSTLTISATGSEANSFPTDSGTATPSGGVLNVFGGTSARDINTSGSGNTIHVDLNNAITLGDLAVITTGNDALTVTSGDITLSGTGVNAGGNLNIPNSSSTGDIGLINVGGNRFISNVAAATTGVNTNIFMGIDSGNLAGTTTAACIGIGADVMQNITGIAAHNISIGNESSVALTTGRANCIIGHSGLTNATTSTNNTGIGYTVLSRLGTGTNNSCFGYATGTNYTGAESNNILIGFNVLGTLGESNICRVGIGTGASDGQLSKTFISGIRGITTDVNDAVAVLVDSAGQLGTVSSSLRFKDNIQDMADDSSDVMNLRPVTFEYKTQPGIKQYGLIAEEVEEHMPRMVVHDDEGLPSSVKYHELPAILLNEIQKLSNRVKELEDKFLNS